jgi:hypothetical protein
MFSDYRFLQVLPVTNGTAASLDNVQFTSHLAGMLKQQLYDVMVQMKDSQMCVAAWTF